MRSGYKVHTDGGVVVLIEQVVGESKKKTGFSNSWISYHDYFEEKITKLDGFIVGTIL